MASREVEDAVGEAPERRPSAVEQLAVKKAKRVATQEALVQARAAMDEDQIMLLQQRLAALDEIIGNLEAEAQKEIEADARAEAEQRLKGIRSALGSIRTSMDVSEERVVDLVKQLTDAITRFNRAYLNADSLSREEAALVDRFNLASEGVVMPDAPDQRGIVMDLIPKLEGEKQAIKRAGAPATEYHDETGWQRRTYSEVEGTRAGEIIALAGPKPWPPLTPEQVEILRQRKEREESNRQRMAKDLADAVLYGTEREGPLPRLR